MSEDDVETVREGMRLARTFAAQWGERDAALDRILAELAELELERDVLRAERGAIAEAVRRIVNDADPDRSEYDAGKMYVVQELETAIATAEEQK